MENSNASKAASRQAVLKRIASGSVSYLGLVVLIVLFSILTGGSFLSADNLGTVAKQGFTIFIAALAAVFVMATGNLDFSIGANVGFSCAVCAIVCKQVAPAAGVAAAILTGGAIGALNGLIITKFKLPSFITCLCMMFILTAATQSMCAAWGGSISMPLKMRKWESLELYAVIGVLYFALMFVMFRYTKFGKYMKALGVSVEASRQSGVVVNRMMFLGYLLSGLAAGFAGFLTLIRVGGAASTTGQTLTTDVIIAIVFGGMSVAGGASSKISAALIGTLIIVLLNNGMVMAGYGGDLQQLVKGLLFLIIIAVSMKRDANMIIK